MAVRYSKIKSELFINNRKSLISLLDSESILVLQSNDLMPRNGDCTFPFRQDSDFFYLTGIDQEESVLFLFPDAKSKKDQEVLFIKKTNKHIKIWEGKKYSKEQARKVSGIKNVQYLGAMQAYIESKFGEVQKVYFNKNENERASSPVISRNQRLAQELKLTYKKHEFKSVAPLISTLRVIKSDLEIELIKHACTITKLAFERLLKMVKPGVGEHEIEAEITHEFICRNAQGHAYSPIIASGKNACVLHYIDNHEVCQSGDLLLLDFGAEYANYASDLSRTIPVNGVFTKRQKQVYNAVLRVFKLAKTNMVVGNTLRKLQNTVIKQMEIELVELGLLTIKEIKNQNPEEPLFKKYFMHGVSHFMGIDVHDVGERNTVFQDGMVLTCEPGIYIQKEGIGIRIENDILISGSNPIDLMESIPIEADEIESLMKKR